MRKIIAIATVITLTAAAGAATAAAASGGKYKTKTQECLERARAKRFGVHFIKRERWIRECIRGRV